MSDPFVLDAAITQDGNTLNLVLIVAGLTTYNKAVELGEKFVRMAKSLSPDDGPGKEIGRGKYHYLIGVYYANEDQVALGAKSGGATRIRW